MGSSTGDGTRPTTDGTVDNIGAGERMTPSGNAAPAPRERMSDKRSDAESVEHDDSAPFGLRERAKDIASDRGNSELP